MIIYKIRFNKMSFRYIIEVCKCKPVMYEVYINDRMDYFNIPAESIKNILFMIFKIHFITRFDEIKDQVDILFHELVKLCITCYLKDIAIDGRVVIDPHWKCGLAWNSIGVVQTYLNPKLINDKLHSLIDPWLPLSEMFKLWDELRFFDKIPQKLENIKGILCNKTLYDDHQPYIDELCSIITQCVSLCEKYEKMTPPFITRYPTDDEINELLKLHINVRERIKLYIF